MLQYRLSTLFLIFFVVAATLALFGAGGIWFSVVLLLLAFCLNRAESLMNGVYLSIFIILIGIVCPGLLLPAMGDAREAARRCACCSNLKRLGLGLLNYHDSRKHFPSVFTCDKDGKPLFSLVMPFLSNFEYDSIYKQLKKDEPWNSSYNTQVLSQIPITEFQCPSSNHGDYDFITNYVAIIGPGTIWRNEETVKLSDLPDGGSHTVVLVEVVDSGKHWAEPFALTVDDVLKNMKTSKGVRISSCHPAGVHVVFANDVVRRFPSKMPLSLWRRILAGEVPAKDLDNINSLIDPNAPDMVDVYVGNRAPKLWSIILGVTVWLISVVLLFHRAIKSRKRPEIEAVIQATAS